MSDEITPADKQEVSETEEMVRKLFSQKILDLDQSETELLSKVLFPDTHNVEVTLGEKKRKLRPLSLKASREMFLALKPFSLKQREILNSPTPVDISDDLIENMKTVLKIMSSFYKWDDVPALLENEELSVTEMQSAILTQEQIDGANNFLLGGLRVLVSVMRLNELVSIRFLNMLSTSSSARSRVAVSKSS